MQIGLTHFRPDTRFGDISNSEDPAQMPQSAANSFSISVNWLSINSHFCLWHVYVMSVLSFSCPCDECQGALCFTPVRLSVFRTKRSLYDQLLLQFFKQLIWNLTQMFQALWRCASPFLKRKKSFLSQLQHFWTLKFYSFWLIHYREFV